MTSSSSPAAPRCRSLSSAARRRRASRNRPINASSTTADIPQWGCSRGVASRRPSPVRNRRRAPKKLRAGPTRPARRRTARRRGDAGPVRCRLAAGSVYSLTVRRPRVLDWLASGQRGGLGLQGLGELNVAPEDRDVHDPKRWEGEIHVSPPERAAWRGVVDAGLADAFRLFPQPEKQFSWWDYRLLRFHRNWGLRIDHILLSRELAARCTASSIDREPRKRERPSDHAPVIADLN